MPVILLNDISLCMLGKQTSKDAKRFDEMRRYDMLIVEYAQMVAVSFK